MKLLKKINIWIILFLVFIIVLLLNLFGAIDFESAIIILAFLEFAIFFGGICNCKQLLL
ncbi:hypothetical protein RJG79_04930 [Mycoplasmatota bacterium WC44]